MTVLDQFRLTGRRALVTGGGRGLGRVIAQALAEAGADVALGARRVDRLADTAGLVERTGRTALTHGTDVSDPQSCTDLVALAMEEFGHVDVLVNNAGIGTAVPATRETPEQFRQVIDVNLNGCYWMAQACGRVMQPGSSIINISSVLGLIPAPYSAHYSATKHAIEGYSESLDHEVRAFNIRVSVIEPAFVRTVFDQNGIEPDSVLKESDRARAGVDALLRDVMPRADRPEVVADVVVKAATDARPQRRYTAGKAARQVSMLRRFAPAEIFDKSLRKQFRLPV
jgi:NAD(P)-dependent dehydrogenase (short-subunit alcohol dehydrogenase family)